MTQETLLLLTRVFIAIGALSVASGLHTRHGVAPVAAAQLSALAVVVLHAFW